MDLARIRSQITVVPVVTLLTSMSIMTTMATATPPSSELNGVAKIAPAADLDAPVIIEPGQVDVMPTTSDVEASSPSVQSSLSVMAVGAGDSPIEPVIESTTPESVVVADGDSRPLDADMDPGPEPSVEDEDASRAAAAAVLSTAGEIASFDRTPIFGRAGNASGETAAGTPLTTTTPVGTATRWWNAPELRVFGLLALLVLAAVFMKRHGGRSIGLAGGPRPSGVVSVLGRFPFGRSASLVLLECGPKVLLLHQHAGKGGEVTTLAEFSDRDEVADLRGRLTATERDAKGGFGRELEQNLGLYDRRGRPRGFGGEDGLPVQGPIETVDLTRRRPRRGVRGN